MWVIALAAKAIPRPPMYAACVSNTTPVIILKQEAKPDEQTCPLCYFLMLDSDFWGICTDSVKNIL